ncbi:MAG: citramalate synthase, partial [Treponema sp.]|nr:citramalate synthase [Treponema sp.]
MKPGAAIEVELLDTTLRDGAQGGGISFSIQDKLAIVQALDVLGLTWIEAGNPGSNPKDMEFFRLARGLTLEHARLCAFGSTRKKGHTPGTDPQLQHLLDAATETVVIFGKSWDLQVTEVLGVGLQENCTMIAETVGFLKEQGRTVIYDAEHFFDGWAANPAYALKTVQEALEAGADRIVLCDTNGGTFPDRIAQGTAAAQALISAAQKAPILGIHAHNDADMASACSLTAVQAGCRHVQGTLLGFGERCGNTSLAAVIPSIALKLGFRCLPAGKLAHLFEVSHRVAEIANVVVPDTMPYVGVHAFSHKAGMHADGILKVRRSFEHIDPVLVGNDRHFLMSEIGGRSAIAERAKKIDPRITKDHPVTATLAARLKTLEAEGWQFEGADASFELLVRQELGLYQPRFKLDAYRVVCEHPSGGTLACAHAWAKVWVDGQHEIAAA